MAEPYDRELSYIEPIAEGRRAVYDVIHSLVIINEEMQSKGKLLRSYDEIEEQVVRSNASMGFAAYDTIILRNEGSRACE